jgi:hypothetical protein
MLMSQKMLNVKCFHKLRLRQTVLILSASSPESPSQSGERDLKTYYTQYSVAKIFRLQTPVYFLGRSVYLVVIIRDASFNPSAVALTLIFPGVFSGRIIARHIP